MMWKPSLSQVDNGQGSVRHSGETREEWNRAVSKIGRDFLIKEVCPSNSPPLDTVKNCFLLSSIVTGQAFMPCSQL